MFDKLKNLFRHEALGLLRRVPDVRDLYFKELGLGTYKRPGNFKLLAPLFIENQFGLNVCWAEAWANALAVFQGKQISVRWITGVAWFRRWCGINGAQLKVAGDVVRKRLIGTYGFLLEKEMESDESIGWDKFTDIDIEGNIETASKRAIGSYRFCETPDEILQSIDRGYPVVIGRYWTNKFDDGYVLKPNRNAYMAHATVIVGYDGDNVIEANSWGTSWGNKGLFKTPINQLQGDIDTFGAIAITNIPYTPKEVKVNELQEQVKYIMGLIKGMLARDTFYKTALGIYRSGVIVSAQNKLLGCGYAMTYVWNKAFPDRMVNFVGTGDWWSHLKKSDDWQEVLDPEPDCVIVSPTPAIPPQSPLSNGHIGIVGHNKAPDGSNWILSNNSLTGKLDAHWTVKSWNDYYHNYGKIKTSYFRLLG